MRRRVVAKRSTQKTLGKLIQETDSDTIIVAELFKPGPTESGGGNQEIFAPPPKKKVLGPPKNHNTVVFQPTPSILNFHIEIE